MSMPRVLHVVTGGFSGATQVAIDLVRGARASGRNQPFLALRRKSTTSPERVEALRDEGMDVTVLPGWSHLATIVALRRLCQRIKPDVLVAHGFPEHLLGRHAGRWADVPHLVQVEHNSRERYSAWRLAQTRWLAPHTDRIVGCSEGVKGALLAQGLPEDRVMAIPNGIRLEPFAQADAHPWAARVPGLVMCARFASQKDHATLLQALALLRQQGLRPPLLLAGSGSARHRRKVVDLCAALGLNDQVQFLGFQKDIPGLLMRHQVAVLSSHYEGMPLSLVEGMAAGCVAVGSSVPGIEELLNDGVTGRLVPHADAAALARTLADVLQQPEASARMAAAGRAAALQHHSLGLMTARYDELFDVLVDPALA
ncbi:glycosyltransferase [Ideonella margarita]|uniref:Glycosyltransferase n=1 Tax=Ideonella margarita TaxID=2984191 RepID=A0ABU9C5C7_9BURK